MWLTSTLPELFKSVLGVGKRHEWQKAEPLKQAARLRSWLDYSGVDGHILLEEENSSEDMVESMGTVARSVGYTYGEVD